MLVALSRAHAPSAPAITCLSDLRKRGERTPGQIAVDAPARGNT
jgi:hypothetical protein